mmetsp:Transcript_31005/g.64698  ORF Transcript_31005/g.64698 Transcript_31005/m.64698 type:complete len:307 (-) Transcript_31005:156-1076(-)
MTTNLLFAILSRDPPVGFVSRFALPRIVRMTKKNKKDHARSCLALKRNFQKTTGLETLPCEEGIHDIYCGSFPASGQTECSGDAGTGVNLNGGVSFVEIGTDDNQQCVLRLTPAAEDIKRATYMVSNLASSTTAFSMELGYQIHSSEEGSHAHGMAFVLHQDPRGVNGGAHLGNEKIRGALVVVMRTYQRKAIDVLLYSTSEAAGRETKLGTIEGDPRTGGTAIGRLWVEYCDGDDQLRIYHDASGAQEKKLVLTAPFDLSSFFDLDNEIYMGFTAATGQYKDNHDVLDFCWKIGPTGASCSAFAV